MELKENIYKKRKYQSMASLFQARTVRSQEPLRSSRSPKCRHVTWSSWPRQERWHRSVFRSQTAIPPSYSPVRISRSPTCGRKRNKSVPKKCAPSSASNPEVCAETRNRSGRSYWFKLENSAGFLLRGQGI